jgi:diguanylate cyclase
MDLDGFKGINDHYGHDGGDHVLKQFAQRLKSCVRETDTVARLAGDEFVILLEGLKNGPSDAEKVGTKILFAMREPMILNGESCQISTSIGIYLRESEQDTDPEQMISAADHAMYHAKRAGKNKIHLAKVG